MLNRARAEIGAPGSVESPLGSNSGTKYHQWYGGVQGYQWCAIFQSWLFFPTLGYKSYYTGDWINYGTRNGWMILGPAPGAICVMDRYPYLEQGGISDHIGVIESVNGSARTMTLIEGNYGDRVARVTRPIDGSTKYYFIMPKYASKPQEDEMAITVSDYGVTVDRYSSYTAGKPIHVDIMNCGDANLAARILMTPSKGGPQILKDGGIAAIEPEKHFAVNVVKAFNLPQNLDFDLKVESVNGQPMKVKYTE